MTWRKTEPMEERLKLIADRLAGYSITELAVIYGVSRKTVYKWTKRYDRIGQEGLKELCRAPVNHPNQTNDEIIGRLVEAKMLHMNWGPKKLLDFLNMRQPQLNWPSVCTVEKWLKRQGLVKNRRLRKRTRRTVNRFWPATCRTGSGAQTTKASSRQATADGAIP